MMKFINKIDATHQNHNLVIQNQAASINNLETQIGQHTALLKEWVQGNLLSNTETNSKENVHVIQLRSGKLLEDRYVEASTTKAKASWREFKW